MVASFDQSISQPTSKQVSKQQRKRFRLGSLVDRSGPSLLSAKKGRPRAKGGQVVSPVRFRLGFLAGRRRQGELCGVLLANWRLCLVVSFWDYLEGLVAKRSKVWEVICTLVRRWKELEVRFTPLVVILVKPVD
ncbi:hypothetical protein Droror1_Dr00026991 [Drosera rotundifolia]